jgi:hypothetical protein
MTTSLSLVRAPHIGVREFKENLSLFLKKNKLLIVTDHGEPTRVVVPYNDMLEILDIIEEINDAEITSLVKEGRKAILAGS